MADSRHAQRLAFRRLRIETTRFMYSRPKGVERRANARSCEEHKDVGCLVLLATVGSIVSETIDGSTKPLCKKNPGRETWWRLELT